jgi:hypothetical protein
MPRHIDEVMRHPKISTAAKVTLFHLMRSARNGFSDLSGVELEERVGVTQDTISKVAKELHEAGLARRIPAKGLGTGRRRWQLFALAGIISFGSQTMPSPADSHACLTNQTNRSIIKGQRRKKRVRLLNEAA